MKGSAKVQIKLQNPPASPKILLKRVKKKNTVNNELTLTLNTVSIFYS